MKSGKLLLKWLKLDLKKYEKQHNRGKWQKVLLIGFLRDDMLNNE